MAAWFSICFDESDLDEEVITVRRINDVVIVLRQASRNMADTWREITFGGIVRIQFPVASPASPETAVKSERTRTVTPLQALRNGMRPDSAPSGL